jgi:hypothetical protein
MIGRIVPTTFQSTCAGMGKQKNPTTTFRETDLTCKRHAGIRHETKTVINRKCKTINHHSGTSKYFNEIYLTLICISINYEKNKMGHSSLRTYRWKICE